MGVAFHYMQKHIAVTVIPNSSHNEVAKLSDNSYRVKTTAPARDNKANCVVLKLLAKHLAVRKSQLILIAGQKAKEKIFQILD